MDDDQQTTEQLSATPEQLPVPNDPEQQEQQAVQPEETPKEAPKGPEQPKDLIAKARQEEKAKLYPQLQRLEAENKQLKDENAELKTQNSALASELEEARKTMDEQAQAQATQQLTAEQIRAEFKAELDRRDAEALKQKQESELALYRQQKVHEANGALIAELVSGDSKEAIDASVEAAKARYAAIVEAAKASAPAPQAPPLVNPGNIPQGQQPLDLSKIRSVSDKDWASIRREAMEAAGTYRGASN